MCYYSRSEESKFLNMPTDSPNKLVCFYDSVNKSHRCAINEGETHLFVLR